MTIDAPLATTDLEAETAALLAELTNVQELLLDVLQRKRSYMASGDVQGMAALQDSERELCQRLEACHGRRGALLEQADHQGQPAANLGQLATRVGGDDRGNLHRQLRRVSSRMRLVQHQSLTNWVIAQRTLLHLAQLLEVIATGGQLPPTYGRSAAANARGALVDEEA